MSENVKKNKTEEMSTGDVQEKMLQCMYLFIVYVLLMSSFVLSFYKDWRYKF
jgi:hypothetical protein